MGWDRYHSHDIEMWAYVLLVCIEFSLYVALQSLNPSPLIRLNTILIRNATPSQEALGATFGLAQTVACVARAGSPALVR